MLEATQRRNIQASAIGSNPQDRQRRRLLVAIVLLLSTVVLILAKDREFWFGAEEASAEDVQPAAVSATAQAPAVPAQTTNPVATKPATKSAPERAASQANVVARSKHNAAQTSALRSSASQRTPASTAAESVQIASAKTPVVDSAYPMLTGQTSVQGSVLMEALIAADGAVEDLRVLSGPTILVSAARDAVRQWRFKPYLQGGKPVETSARVTVNFTIKVSNNVARYQPTTITSDGAL
jgi:TonB family protein